MRNPVVFIPPTETREEINSVITSFPNKSAAKKKIIFVPNINNHVFSFTRMVDNDVFLTKSISFLNCILFHGMRI